MDKFKVFYACENIKEILRCVMNTAVVLSLGIGALYTVFFYLGELKPW